MKDQDRAALDVLEGAPKVAEFMFGDPKRARSVYHLERTGQAPFFRLGSTICARRSRLTAWIEAQENAALKTGAAA